MMATINVLTPGTQTTIQDLGRPQHQIDGFPESGSMDQEAMKIANLLVGNPLGAPVLEFVLTGPTITFDQPAFIAITGGNVTPQLNGEPLPSYQCIQIHSGDQLAIGNMSAGVFGYLAIKGGWQVNKLLDSYSTILRLQLGGYHGRQLKSGDQLNYHSTMTLTAYYHRRTTTPHWPAKQQVVTIHVLAGPQWTDFSANDQQLFTSQVYQVSSNVDRMGYRLQGNRLTTTLPSMLSTATVRGAIQLTTNGQPIVLMADRQTTGGYPLIAVVASYDLNKLVQCRPGQKIKFNLIDLATATARLRKKEQMLTDLANKISDTRYIPPYGINRVASQRIKQLF